MPNWVGNSFVVYGSEDKKSQVEDAVKALITRLKAEDLKKVLWEGVPTHPDFDRRTELTAEWGSEFGFQSAWGATYAVQDRICELLAKIDPLVIVQNDYQEEAYNFVGTRLVTYDDGELNWFNSERDLSEDLEEIDDKISALENGDNDNDEEDGEVGKKDESASAVTLDELEIERDKLIDNIKIQMEEESWVELYEEIPSRQKCVPVM